MKTLDAAIAVGVTENVSRAGVLVRLQPQAFVKDCPKPGDCVEVDLELPSAGGRRSKRCLHCDGSVARVQVNQSGCTWLGLRIDWMQFRELPDFTDSPMDSVSEQQVM